MKAYFLPRFIAYIIDIILVFMVSTLIMTVIPKNSNIEQLQKETKEIKEKFTNKEITQKQYIERAKTLTYDYQYANVPYSIVDIVILILYFVIFQFYNKGQTFGKKLMKVRMVSSDESALTMDQLIVRALVLQSILINIALIGAVLFMKKYYYYTDLSLTLLQSAIILVSVGMVLFRNDGRGIHDMIAKTKVIMIEGESK